MKKHDFILHSLAIESGKAVELHELKEISSLISSEQLGWVHLDGTNALSKPFLQQASNTADELILEALFSEETRPRTALLDEGILIILRGVNLNENDAPEDMISLRLWLDQYCLVSVQRRPLKAIADTYNKLLSQKSEATSGEIVASLITKLFQRMQPTLSNLSDQIDDLEDLFIENPHLISNQQIVQLRKKIIKFRRYIAPQKQAIATILESEISWLNKASKRQLHETYDIILRHLESLDNYRERSQIIADELAHFHASKMNQNMYILSIIAAIFLPLSFLPGLLGINIGGIPGANNDHAFFIFCGLLVCVACFQLYLFRRLKWL